MKLYLLRHKEINGYEIAIGYDMFDSCVVCAHDEEDAKLIEPSSSANEGWKPFVPTDRWSEWVNTVDEISCEYIGEAASHLKRGVIIASYNAS